MLVTVSEERPRTTDAGVKQTHGVDGTVMRASPCDERVGGQGSVQQGSRDDGRTRHEERLLLVLRSWWCARCEGTPGNGCVCAVVSGWTEGLLRLRRHPKIWLKGLCRGACQNRQ